MAKLSMSVNNNDEDKKKKKDDDMSLSLSMKIEKNKDQNKTDDFDNTQKISTKIESNKDISDQKAIKIAEWLINIIGTGVFADIKANPYLQLPYTDENTDIKQWLAKAVIAIFTKENIDTIYNSITKQNNEDINDKLEKYNIKFKELQNRIQDLEEEKYKIQTELNTSLPLDAFINEFYGQRGRVNENQKRLIDTLEETLQNKDEKDLSKFIMKFTKGWIYLTSVFDTLGDDEQQNLEKVYNALTVMLEYISGIYIPERRPLLDIIADICSEKFGEYDFISPEQTLQPDPDIHNAEGLGNSRIKEGVTFAVVRKNTRKTVKYAEIRVS